MTLTTATLSLAMLITAGTPLSDKALLRVATFNIFELSTAKLEAVDEAGCGSHPQARQAAEVIQRVRPDILLVNEIDFDAERQNAARFRDRYLKVAQNNQKPIDYPHIFFEPVNTGLPTGLDLDHDGQTGGPADAIGFGRYPGQYGMALYSRYPIDRRQARTFQRLLWKDMPSSNIPDGQAGKPAFYTPADTAVLRLSSKSHWDVPINIGPTVIHILAAHPTPPVFDGSEDRNGRRNFDEIRLLSNLITAGPAASYIVDDQGKRGGIDSKASFVILGDLNADPVKDSRVYGRPAIAQILDHPRVQDPQPVSKGGQAHPSRYPGRRELRTCDFGRIDYVLPNREMTVVASGVYWPAPGEPGRLLVEGTECSSDHRLVWVDLRLPAAKSEH